MSDKRTGGMWHIDITIGRINLRVFTVFIIMCFDRLQYLISVLLVFSIDDTTGVPKGTLEEFKAPPH